MNFTDDTKMQLESAVFMRLLQHLDDHKDVQNIDLMNLAHFCRNCLAKWYVQAAEAKGLNMTYEEAREIIYGMPYSEWKTLYQTPASTTALATFNQTASPTHENP